MGGVWVWTPFLLKWPHFGKKTLTLFEDIKFPCKFHKILADFSKNCPDNLRFNRKILDFFLTRFIENHFCQNFLENSLSIFSFMWKVSKLIEMLRKSFLMKLVQKFKMSRLLKILSVVNSLIFTITSNNEMLVVFRQFDINSHN